MKNTLFIILLFTSSLSFSQSDEYFVIKKIVNEYQKDSIKIFYRFNNSDLLNELSIIKSLQDKKIMDEYFPDKDSVDVDVLLGIAGAKMYDDSVTVRLEKIKLNFFSILELVDKKRNKRLKKVYNSDYTNKRKKRPIIFISYPLVSENKKEAIIFVSYICGSLCGNGNFLKLHKKNEEWVTVEKIHRWTS